MKLTRKQELYLIDLGLQKLLDSVIAPPKPVKKTGKKWTKEQRAKFMKTMKSKWEEGKDDKK